MRPKEAFCADPAMPLAKMLPVISEAPVRVLLRISSSRPSAILRGKSGSSSDWRQVVKKSAAPGPIIARICSGVLMLHEPISGMSMPRA